MNHQKESYKFQKIVTVVAIVLFGIKITAWYLTNSVAVLTDALESIVNIVSAFIGLYSLYLSAQPKDKNHPYGHGKVEFISAAIEGIMIVFAGVWIIFESIGHLINPHEIKSLDFGVLLIAIAAFFNLLIGWIAVKKGKKNNSIALIAGGKHLISDTYTSAGVIIGLLIISFTNILWLDGVVAIIFGAVIIVTGIKIIRQSLAGIMDEADEELLGKVVALLDASRQENWVDLHNLRIIKYGSTLHIDCHFTLPWYFSIKEAHLEVDALEKLVRNNFGSSVELFIHADYCQYFSCKICSKNNCKARKNKFVKTIKWTVNNVSYNKSHGIND